MSELAIDIRPATSVYGTYRRLSYKPWFAIAEFIDNSTQSYYDHIFELKEDPNFKRMVINIRYDAGEKILEIIDNAFGMNWENFQRALILDKPPLNREGRNEFGMGLKTAACWFGNLWTVETTEYGSNKMFSATMDIKKLESEKTESIVPVVTHVPFEMHQTKITIRDLNQVMASSAIRKTKDLLERIYRNDLRSGEIDIIWNGEHLKYSEIEILKDEMPDGTVKEWKDSVEFEVNDPFGKVFHVKGWIGLQSVGRTKQSGFALLRRGRVVVGTDSNYYPEEIFHTGQTYEKLYLVGELDLYDFEITQAKDGFMWDNGLEDSFIECLTRELGSREYFNRIKKLKNKNEAKKVSEISEETKREIISTTVGKFKELTKTSKSLFDDHLFENLANNLKVCESNDINYSSNLNVEQRKIDDFSLVKNVYEFDVENYSINVKWDDRSELGYWLSVDNETDKGFDLIINIRHRFFTPYQNQPEFLNVINQFAIALVLSEKKARSSSSNANGLIEPFAIRTYMNQLLEKLAIEKE
jgi:hypothetical protein